MLTAQQRQQTPTLHNSTHDVTILKSLLDQGVEVDARDDLVCTSLHWSCAQNQTDAAEFLLQNGADIEATDKNGLTPLHWAAVTGSYDTTLLLLEYGAKIDAKTSDGQSALKLSKWKGFQDVSDLLTQGYTGVLKTLKTKSKTRISYLEKDLTKLQQTLATENQSLKKTTKSLSQKVHHQDQDLNELRRIKSKAQQENTLLSQKVEALTAQQQETNKELNTLAHQYSLVHAKTLDHVLLSSVQVYQYRFNGGPKGLDSVLDQAEVFLRGYSNQHVVEINNLYTKSTYFNSEIQRHLSLVQKLTVQDAKICAAKNQLLDNISNFTKSSTSVVNSVQASQTDCFVRIENVQDLVDAYCRFFDIKLGEQQRKFKEILQQEDVETSELSLQTSTKEVVVHGKENVGKDEVDDETSDFSLSSLESESVAEVASFADGNANGVSKSVSFKLTPSQQNKNSNQENDVQFNQTKGLEDEDIKIASYTFTTWRNDRKQKLERMEKQNKKLSSDLLKQLSKILTPKTPSSSDNNDEFNATDFQTLVVECLSTQSELSTSLKLEQESRLEFDLPHSTILKGLFRIIESDQQTLLLIEKTLALYDQLTEVSKEYDQSSILLDQERFVKKYKEKMSAKKLMMLAKMEMEEQDDVVFSMTSGSGGEEERKGEYTKALLSYRHKNQELEREMRILLKLSNSLFPELKFTHTWLHSELMVVDGKMIIGNRCIEQYDIIEESVSYNHRHSILKASLSQPTHIVTLKKFHLSTDLEKKAFVKHVYYLSTLVHPNLIFPDLFFLTSNEQTGYIQYEYYSKERCLKSWLEHVVETKNLLSISVQQTFQSVAKDVLFGLEFLAARGICHGGIKSEFIFESMDGRWRLGELELTNQNHVDPSTPPQTSTSDVYAYGILLLEMHFNMKIVGSVTIQDVVSRIASHPCEELVDLITKTLNNQLTAYQALEHEYFSLIFINSEGNTNLDVVSGKKCIICNAHEKVHKSYCQAGHAICFACIQDYGGSLCKSGMMLGEGLACPYRKCNEMYSVETIVKSFRDPKIVQFILESISGGNKTMIAAGDDDGEVQVDDGLHAILSNRIHDDELSEESRAWLFPSTSNTASKVDEKVEKHVKLIKDKILLTKCPRCSHLFQNFTGSLDCTCLECSSRFCSLCFQDCGSLDEHVQAHIAVCVNNYEGKKGGGDVSVFEYNSIQRKRKVGLIKWHLKENVCDEEVEKRVLEVLEEDFKKFQIAL